MAPSKKSLAKERAVKALNAMKGCGFPMDKSKIVLKKLLEACEKNWDFIEADNYSLLVDALVDNDQKAPDNKKKRVDDDDGDDGGMLTPETELHRKKPQFKPEAISSHDSARVVKKPKLEGPFLGDVKGKRVAIDVIHGKVDHGPPSTYQMHTIPVSDQALIPYKEPKIEPGIEFVPNKVITNSASGFHDNEPDNGSLNFEVPIAVVPPADSLRDPGHGNQLKGSFGTGDSILQGNALETIALKKMDMRNITEYTPSLNCGNVTNGQIADSSSNIGIASSPDGKVKLSLSCENVGADFHMPSLESVLKMVEDRCLKSYKILQPNFSLMNVMKEVCKTVLELGGSGDDRRETLVNITPSLENLKTTEAQSSLCGLYTSSSTLLREVSGLVPMNSLQRNTLANRKSKGACEVVHNKCKTDQVNEPPHSLSLVTVGRHEPALGDVRPVHDVNDITKGLENIRISLVNEIDNSYPPSFFYIPQNIVYQNGYVNFSLARIGDEDCCPDCFGDCLSSSIPCACARETGGEYAYTLAGVIKKEFLDDCIARVHDPKKHHLTYCKDCPLERSKNDEMPDPCKGHLVRKFIKECWVKCGCNKQCGNRVVQRGITCNFQVFLTGDGKGWGLRTLDELPRGTFVCEYVGEVLTNMELYDRTIKTTGNAKHTYPVLLDADWTSEGVLKDEEALCLDATFYGNVARFINHRCYDSNLIEIPVEVETADHHYYHLAFFTTRKVEAFEELTWDYGIDFEDHTHPVKAFRCRCGSKYCRDMKRTSRSRARALVVS